MSQLEMNRASDPDTSWPTTGLGALRPTGSFLGHVASSFYRTLT